MSSLPSVNTSVVLPSSSFREEPRRIVRQGLLVVLCFFGTMAAISVLGELSGAIVTPGTVRVDSHSKKVQHLEGGIVDTIRIREGDHVVAGEVLITLQNVNAEASVDLYRKTLVAHLATQARLLAEKEFREEVTWTNELLNLVAEYKAQDVIEGEKKLFRSRMDGYTSERALLHSQMLQIEAQIAGLREQANAEKSIIGAYQEEYEAKNQLYRERFVDKGQLLELRRQLSTHKGSLGRINQQIAELSQKKDETKMRAQDLSIRFIFEIHKELTVLETQIAQTREQIKPLLDAQARLNILAPATGRVVNLRINTAGGVIQSGEELMTIVPDNMPLVVEAEIPVDRIADVYVNQAAQVQMDAFDVRTTPMLPGKVVYISADRLEKQSYMGTSPYYLCHVEVPLEALTEAKVYLSPGMPVTAYITTSKRTVLTYMLEPLLKNWERALRD